MATSTAVKTWSEAPDGAAQQFIEPGTRRAPRRPGLGHGAGLRGVVGRGRGSRRPPQRRRARRRRRGPLRAHRLAGRRRRHGLDAARPRRLPRVAPRRASGSRQTGRYLHDVRPPSVDGLARSLADTGLPHPLLVDVARAAIAAGDPASARRLRRRPAAAACSGRSSTPPACCCTPTSVGRPLAVRQDAAATQPRARPRHRPARLAPEPRRPRCWPALCGAEAAIVVNNNAAAVLLVLAALAARPRGAGQPRRERRDRRRLPRARGAWRSPAPGSSTSGTTNRTRLADYERAVDRPGADVALVLKVHPSNYRVEGFTEAVARAASWPALAVPVVADIGSGLLDAACPWLAGGPPAWLAGEPAARQTLAAGAALVTFSGDKLLGGPQAGIIAGRADLVAALRRPPPGPRPAARRPRARRRCRTSPSPTCAATASAMPVLAHGHACRWTSCGGGPTRPWRVRRRRSSTPTRCPAPGRCPGVAIPSVGVAVDGDHTAALRAADPPIIARVQRRPHHPRPAHRRPGRRRLLARALGAWRTSAEACTSSPPPATSTTASRRSCWPSPAPTPTASTRRSAAASPSTSASPTRRCRRGPGISFVDVPGHVRFLKNMLAGVGAVDACLFVVAATEGWKPQSEEHLRILELLGIRHGLVALTKVDLVDDEELASSPASTSSRPRGRHVPGGRRGRGRGRADRRRASTSCAAALDRLLAATPAGRRPRPAPPLGRPGVRRQGRGHGRDRHAHRRPRRRGRRTWPSGRRPRPARVRAIQSLGDAHERDRARPSRRAQPERRRAHRGRPGRRRRRARAVAAHARGSTPRSTVLAALDHDVSRPRRLRRLRRLGRAPGARPGPRRRARSARGPQGLVRLHLASAAPAAARRPLRAARERAGRDRRRRRGARRRARAAGVEGPARPLRRPGGRRAGLDRRRRAGACSPASERTPTLGPLGRGPRRGRGDGRRARRRGSAAAGPLGLDVATLDERERAVPRRSPRAWRSAPGGPRAGGGRPPGRPPVPGRARGRRLLPRPAPDGVDRAELRELVRRGLVVERDGVWFAPSAVDAAAARGRRAAGRQPRRASRWPSSATRSARPASTRCRCWPRARRPRRHPPPGRPAHRRPPPARPSES